MSPEGHYYNILTSDIGLLSFTNLNREIKLIKMSIAIYFVSLTLPAKTLSLSLRIWRK